MAVGFLTGLLCWAEEELVKLMRARPPRDMLATAKTPRGVPPTDPSQGDWIAYVNEAREVTSGGNDLSFQGKEDHSAYRYQKAAIVALSLLLVVLSALEAFGGNCCTCLALRFTSRM